MVEDGPESVILPRVAVPDAPKRRCRHKVNTTRNSYRGVIRTATGQHDDHLKIIHLHLEDFARTITIVLLGIVISHESSA